jgi:hypothetical protein
MNGHSRWYQRTIHNKATANLCCFIAQTSLLSVSNGISFQDKVTVWEIQEVLSTL